MQQNTVRSKLYLNFAVNIVTEKDEPTYS